MSLSENEAKSTCFDCGREVIYRATPRGLIKINSYGQLHRCANPRYRSKTYDRQVFGGTQYAIPSEDETFLRKQHRT